MKSVLHFIFGVESVGGIARLIPGAALAIATMLGASMLADVLGQALLRAQGVDPTDKASPIAAVPIAIVLGLVVRNTLRALPGCDAGLKFATTKLLRLGIILIGVNLSFQELLRVGMLVVPAVAVVILAGLGFVMFASRLLGLPPRLGTLLAAGTSICGVSAIVCTAPSIRADEREVAYAVANVTLFGLLAMLVYPIVAPLLLHTSPAIGLFLGTAIHDTSQVIGAALTYRERTGDKWAFEVATVTKLARNLFLVVVVPVLTYISLRRDAAAAGGRRERISVSKLLPAFILGFLLMAVVRSIGDSGLAGGGAALGIFDKEQWGGLTKQLAYVWGARYALGTAMAAVGLSTSFAVFRGVGLRPFVVGFAGAFFVAGVGFVMALFVGPQIGK